MTLLAEDDAPLTAEEILTFGPVVEAAVWNVAWLEERRAPIAVAAGRPRLGKVFNSDGVGRAVLIRPCVSRGRRVRSLPPIYTPRMLEANTSVFTGWPMYFDHMPAGLSEALKRRGRSVRELGGQVLTPYWMGDFTAEYDELYGYQPGASLAEVWANEYVRKLVGNNPDVLHTSISAWPTSGRPGKAPWNANVRGMLIEGIRRQPQGSVDYVPRGGAGGRLQLAEGEDPDTAAWPEPEWTEQDRALVVSVAESVYASREMSDRDRNLTLPSKPDELRAFLTEHAPHLVPALGEAAPAGQPVTTAAAATITADDVKRVAQEAVAEATAGSRTPTEAELREQWEQSFGEMLAERDEQYTLATRAAELIEAAEGLPASWKADLKESYAITKTGAPASLVIQEADCEADDGRTLTPMEVLEARVAADLDKARDRMADVTGKPRVRGEGGAKKDAAGDSRVTEGEEVPYWRQRLAEEGVVESAEDALAIHGYEMAEG